MAGARPGERPAATTPDPGWLVAGLRRAGGVRVHTVPRPIRPDDSTDVDGSSGGPPGRSDGLSDHRLASLAAAYLSDRRQPVVWLAHRERPSGPVELIASGATALPSEAETVGVPTGGLWSRLERHRHWVPLVVRAWPLHATTANPAGPGAAPTRVDADAAGERWGLERALIRYAAPCSILVTGEPVERSAVEKCVRALGQKASIVGGGGPNSQRPEAAEASRHWTGRIGQTRRAIAQGAWLLRVVVGADSVEDAWDLADRVSGAYGPLIGRTGYLLRPGRLTAESAAESTAQPESLDRWDLADRGRSRASALVEALSAAAPDSYASSAYWHWALPDPAAGIVPSQVVSAMIRPPQVELPGVRLYAPPRFDIEPEHTHRAGVPAAVSDDVWLRLGSVLDGDREPAGPFWLPGASLNRHVFVAGATGSGKTTTVRAMLNGASRAGSADGAGSVSGVPWLVVEPTKTEYAAALSAELGPDSDGLVVIRPGDVDRVPAGIDPMRPAPGFRLSTHLDLVRTLFLAAFDATEPFPQVLSLALDRCYTDQGWDLTTGRPRHAGVPPRYPTLTDLKLAAEQVIEEIGYGREVADNIRGFTRVRLASLATGVTGRFLQGGHQLDYGQLLDRNVVIELDDIGDDGHKAFLMGTVLIGLVEHLRVRAATDPDFAHGGLRHLTVFEEAHRLLSKDQADGAAGHATTMISGLLAEIRAYGEGLIIADQIPANLVDGVIKNTAVKLLHRLPAADDRALVGATMNLTRAQSDYVVTLPPGQAAAYADGMDAPVLIAVPQAQAQAVSGHTAVHDAIDVIEPESGRCRIDYELRGRTAGTHAEAHRLLAREPGLRLWPELAVAATLTGQPVPHPTDRLHDVIGRQDPIDVDTALALAVDEAVAGRSQHLTTAVSPADVARHVITTLRALCDGRDMPSPDRELELVRLIAPAYRSRVARHLLTLVLERGESTPSQDQLELLDALIGQINLVHTNELLAYAHDQHLTRSRHDKAGVLFGDGNPTPIDQILPERPTDGDQTEPAAATPWTDRLTALTGEWLRPDTSFGIMAVITEHTGGR